MEECWANGVTDPEQSLRDERVVALVKDVFAADGPVAVLCRAPWKPIEADAPGGRSMASWPNLRTNIPNVGGDWHDKPVTVCDRERHHLNQRPQAGRPQGLHQHLHRRVHQGSKRLTLGPAKARLRYRTGAVESHCKRRAGRLAGPQTPLTGAGDGVTPPWAALPSAPQTSAG
ncbi:DJ-1/PfpI family protein [Streptomyces albipurpureus]|uniref:DJ-1/PfpI family protein n=1 Tax=Streptomyces albipurpureus TaxID=2897419 RepID=UPI003CE4CE56